ncbi:MAG: hypothetical protein LAP13_03025 [Acidobacteriia bacterium]|nr:hypothetical protein [Terriglobia bacterium]
MTLHQSSVPFPVVPSRHPQLVILVSLLVIFIVNSHPAYTQFLYRQQNVVELTRRAEFIVEGRVLEARYEPLPGYPNLPTIRVTLAVEQVLRGAIGPRYTFRQLLLFEPRRSGKRRYVAGDRLLLFLPAPSRYGLSSPLGGDQGRFHIFADRQGHEQIVNDLGNAGLFNNAGEEASGEGLSLTARQQRVVAGRSGAVPLEDFVSLVKNLATLPRSK